MAIALLGLVLSCFPVFPHDWFARDLFAHHGGTAFDISRPLTFQGTIVKLEFINPHARILVDVTGDKGNVVHWTLETHSPVSLLRSGWTKDSLKPGDRVTMIISPAKNGLPVGALTKIILANGRELSPVAK
jgi:hypothetical protein